jgi:uncharacterized protein (TIGR03437 family)
VDAAGNLYIADSGNHRIRKLSKGTITTVAGGGSAGDNGPATSAQLADPQGVALDGTGNLYFADVGSDRIRKISNGVITTAAGTGVPGFGGDGGPATSAQLYHPYGVAVDPAGSLYVAESSQDPTGDGVPNSRIRRVSGGLITSVILWNGPTSVAADGAGNVYFTDDLSDCIRKISKGANTIVAGCQGRGFSGDNGPATKAQLNYPIGLALDSAGNLYFADEGNYRIRKVSGGVITTIAGNGSGHSGDGGLATDAGVGLPTSVAVDTAGNVYVLEDNAWIRKVSNGLITTIASYAIFPSWQPEDIAVDSAGNVYVSDSYSQRIVVLTPPACTYSVAPASMQAPASGVNMTIGIQTSTSCPSTISGLPNWITVSGKASETGNAAITFIIAANTGVARSALVSISGVSVLVAQEAFPAVLSDSPVQVKMVSGSGQSGLPGSPLGNPLVVQVTGHSGAVMAGVTVAFSVASGSATLSAASMQSAADGTAAVSVALGASAGPVVVTAAITGVSAVKFQVTAILGPTISAVVGAGGSVPAITRISPGGLATIYGANFAAPGTARQVQAGDLVGGNLPTQLAGVCVAFNAGSKPVGSGWLTYVSPSQVNFQVPSLPLNTDLNMVVSANCGTAGVQTAVQSVTADEASPEFLYWVKNADGRNPVIAVNSLTGAYVGRAALIAGASFTPAKPGDYLTIYGISFGPTTPAVPPGSAPSATAATTNAPAVMLGTALLDATNVLYAGVSPGTAGLYQLNIRVPDGLTDGDYPITLRLGSFVAPSGGYLTVKNIQVNDFSFEQLILPSEGWGKQPNQPSPGSSPEFSFPSNYAGWNFTGNSGVTLAGTDFSPPNNIPDGLKAALFQGNWAAINQAVIGLKPSVTYTVSLYVGTRYYDGGGVDGNTSVDVKIDGTLIGTTGLLPSSSPFSRYSFTFTVSTPGNHDLSISNSGPPGDHTAFVDSVSITDTIQP